MTIAQLNSLVDSNITKQNSSDRITAAEVRPVLKAQNDEILRRGLVVVANTSVLNTIAGTNFKQVYVRGVGLFELIDTLASPLPANSYPAFQNAGMWTYAGNSSELPFDTTTTSNAGSGGTVQINIGNANADATAFQIRKANNVQMNNAVLAYVGFQPTFSEQITGTTYYQSRQLGFRPPSLWGSVLTVAVNSQPFVISTEPINQSGNPGTDVTFSGAASGGTGPITYQWQTATGDSPASGDWTNISGQTGQTLTLSNIQAPQNARAYRLAATQGGTTIYSQLARLYVNTVYTARVGYVPDGIDPFVSPNQLQLETAVWFPYQTLSGINDAITLLSNQAGFNNIADNYLLYDMDASMTARGKVTNGDNTALIPAAEYSDGRKMTAGGRVIGSSNNGWGLVAGQSITFTIN